MNKAIRVAIQGERGSFSEEAALKLLGERAEVYNCRYFEDVFRLTVGGETDACLIPIENSLTGSIHRNYDLIRRHQLRINQEVYLRIEHNLIVIPGVSLNDIRVVISHPVALGQCEHFFENRPGLKKESSYDTSGSVRDLIQSGSREAAAVASRRAAEIYGGEIVLSGIQDNQENFTRFVLLASDLEPLPDANKTSIVFSFKNSAGALFKSLSVFALRDIDLTKIESRPIHGRPWEYLFYLDFLGSIEEQRVENALNHLREITEFLEVLGCYPRDESVEKKGM